LHHHRNLRRVHYFAHRAKVEFVSCLAHQLEPWFAHALKSVRRRSWLERAATKDFCAGFRNALRHAENLFPGLHRTRPGGDDHLRSADFYSTPEIDDRALRPELPAG